MRTDAEIHERIEEIRNDDFFGFESTDLMARLSFDEARRYLKPETVESNWHALPRDRESILNEMKEYMPFAWDKACNCRGISASRSISHMRAWLWLIGEDELAAKIADYTHYGKPQLRAICEQFGWDWKKWDDKIWRNGEKEDGVAPESVPAV